MLLWVKFPRLSAFCTFVHVGEPRRAFLFPSSGGQQEVQLTALGNATGTVVGATEILKRQPGLLNVKKIETSLSDRGVARYERAMRIIGVCV